MIRNRLIFGVLAFCLVLILAACSVPASKVNDAVQAGPVGPIGPAGPQGLPGPAGKDGLPGKSFYPPPGQGLTVHISGVELSADGKPLISLSLADGAGIPVSPKVLDSSGFTVAQISEDTGTGLSKYQSLLVHDVDGKPYKLNGETKQAALAKAKQAYADSGGLWTDQGEGKFTYKFKNSLSSTADPSLTTVVGVYVSKDARADVANDVYTFVPAGGEPKLTHQVVTTDACQTCHNPLQAHGGLRRDVGLCVTCHTDQTIDPETGFTLDFQVLIHRLHTGSQLPSAAKGAAYMIVGHSQSIADFSKGTWPQDVRNCTTCHQGGAQSDFYKTKPNTAACTSCHDTTNVSTGENHPGGIQTDDKCSACHPSDGSEFDTSITGAHVIPLASSAIKGLKLEILKVEGAVPGGSPVVSFKVTNNTGEAVDPAKMEYLALTLAGPTSDYQQRWTEIAASTERKVPSKVKQAADGTYQYQFEAKIPSDAVGTYAVGMEGYVMQTAGIKGDMRVAAFNPVAYVSLDKSEPVARRQVIDQEKCNACHKNLAAHGTIRQNVEYCVMCHNPTGSDADQRPLAAMPPATISFPLLIHRLHHGDEASQPLKIYGRNGTLADFSDVVFPGDLKSCETCHKTGTNALPLASGIQPTTILQGGKVVSSTLPIRALCTSCHDNPETAGHAELSTTAAGVESCLVCHGPNREFDVTAVHH